MGTGKYILNRKGNPVETDSLLEWASWFENSRESRRVAYTEIGKYAVSTVFLGLDYSFGVGTKPILYETLVFYKKPVTTVILGKKTIHHEIAEDTPQRRYFTKKQAEKGHDEIVQMLEESAKKVKKKKS